MNYVRPNLGVKAEICSTVVIIATNSALEYGSKNAKKRNQFGRVQTTGSEMGGVEFCQQRVHFAGEKRMWLERAVGLIRVCGSGGEEKRL